jgi:hypothetical protein
VERCLGRSAVLVIQDTHTALAVSVDDHEILGVLDRHVWVRAEHKVTKGESCEARKRVGVRVLRRT